MLLFEPSIDDRVAGIHLATHPGVHHHLLGCLVHSQQLAQVHKWFLSGLRVRRVQHLVEHVLDEVVLGFQERDHVVGRLDDHLGHAPYLHGSKSRRMRALGWAARFDLAYPGRMRLNAAALGASLHSASSRGGGLWFLRIATSLTSTSTI